ncbi:hypothetical protein ET495_13175 [Xylanimonas allomyrinae]|uniref:DUF4190 domain-containing protein n=1 Tax=Xylanimonas allomyrinae TaxID=2509459 RepID=A0A4P6EUB1_9MICO|nr:DUF4190 domain-containing protein [Xylanimonas allomyrinae]QAY64017.1 hypothetical protein ET495_13175 [Xylanimonas allomyrinae]
MAEDPGKTLGLVGLIGAFVVPIGGLICSIIGRSKSKKAGFDNKLALWGIIISAVSLAATLVLSVLVIVGTIANVNAEVDKAEEAFKNSEQSFDDGSKADAPWSSESEDSAEDPGLDSGGSGIGDDEYDDSYTVTDSDIDAFIEGLTPEQRKVFEDQGVDLDDPATRERMKKNLQRIADDTRERLKDMPDTDGDGLPDSPYGLDPFGLDDDGY